LRTVYLGTSDFAATVLRRMGESNHRPALTVTPPDRPRGRGRKLTPTPAASAARELGIEVSRTADVNERESLDRIRAVEPQVAVVCAFGQLIKEPLLSELLMMNIHPSLLPRWRGAAPIERAIMAGDAGTGVSVIRVTAGLDSGPIALQERTAISTTENAGTLSARLAGIGGELIVRALDLRAAGQLEFRDQDDGAATYAEKIAPEERRLDPSRPATELAAAVRALTPHVGAYLELDGGGRLGVHAAVAERGETAAGSLTGDDGALRLGCSAGVLRLDVVQPPGGRPMSAEDYLRGHALPPGARVA
jgi:methionyl-tRNA formyltransferase